MNIKHHLDEATLVSYAAGALSQSMALIVACHLSLCPNCRERVYNTEAIGGLLLDSLKPVVIKQRSVDEILRLIEQEPLTVSDKAPIANTSTQHTTTAATEEYTDNLNHNDVPSPLNEYVGDSLDAIDWKLILPGVHYHDLGLRTERGGVSRLLRIAPGKGMLLHTHDGNELTLILRGSFSDDVGRFTFGDVADLDSEIEHQPLVDSYEDCICLIATDAPLQFSTLLGKIVQPITGF